MSNRLFAARALKGQIQQQQQRRRQSTNLSFHKAEVKAFHLQGPKAISEVGSDWLKSYCCSYWFDPGCFLISAPCREGGYLFRLLVPGDTRAPDARAQNDAL